MTLFTRVGLVLAAAGVAGLALAFRAAQNRRGGGAAAAAKGGAISGPKLVWLAYCVLTWFFVCPLVALEPGLAPPLGVALGSFAICMWARGLAEVVMLYVTHSWRPPYGVAHDLLSIALLGGLLFAERDALAALERPLDRGTLVLALSVLASLVLETVYAAWFFRLVEGRTTGEDGIWFADPDDPRYRLVNRVTLAFDVPLVAIVLGYVAAAAAGRL